MKATVYLRVAKTGGSKGYRVAAATRPNHGPLTDAFSNAQPTVAFAVRLNIPDEAFKQAEQVVAEIDVPLENIAITRVEAEPVEA